MNEWEMSTHCIANVLKISVYYFIMFHRQLFIITFMYIFIFKSIFCKNLLHKYAVVTNHKCILLFIDIFGRMHQNVSQYL